MSGWPRTAAADVERYYDEWTHRYLEVGENLIEACRPASTQDLLHYYITSIGLRPGQHLLDAGCGVCGPAAFFAQQLPVTIEALTISQVQVDLARRVLADAGVGDRVSVRKGNYDDLPSLYPPETFDGVMFLESLGHAERPEHVIRNAWTVLKPGGFLYIKDFFARETDDPDARRKVASVTRNIDDNYAYNTLDLHRVLMSARKVGFRIDVIKSPGFDIDVRIRAQFEERNGISIFGGLPEFIPTDWLELRFIRDDGYNANFSARLTD